MIWLVPLSVVVGACVFVVVIARGEGWTPPGTEDAK